LRSTTLCRPRSQQPLIRHPDRRRLTILAALLALVLIPALRAAWPPIHLAKTGSALAL
jgi:hypothetical protein